MKVRFLRARYFVWLIVPLLVYAASFKNIGTPYFRWSYSWADNGQGYDPFADRYYTRCTYVGLKPFKGVTPAAQSSITIYPTNGNCAWFVFRSDKERS